LIQLRSEQKEAIDREDYEVAARLRDEIAELEASMRPGNTPAADE
jgi:protein-arginine kinase activator protein McsA